MNNRSYHFLSVYYVPGTQLSILHAVSHLILIKPYFSIKKNLFGGALVAQSVKHLTSAQVMISWFVSSSPVSGSVLTIQSLEPTSDSVSPSLSALPLLMLCLCLSKINKC